MTSTSSPVICSKKMQLRRIILAIKAYLTQNNVMYFFVKDTWLLNGDLISQKVVGGPVVCTDLNWKAFQLKVR